MNAMQAFKRGCLGEDFARIFRVRCGRLIAALGCLMTGDEVPIVWPTLLEATMRRLREAGLDLVHPFSAAPVAAALGPGVALPHLPASQLDTTAEPLGLIIGNSRALWAPFVTSPEATQKDPHMKGPLDNYVERSVSAAMALSGLEFSIAYSHTLLPAPTPLQRIADAAGFAHLGPAHLSVHTTYGPWFALRAVVVLNFPASELLGLSTQSAPNVCQGCAAPCKVALAEALKHHSDPPPSQHVRLATSPLRLSNHAQAWARVRLVCPLGQEHQYSAPQMKYHYDKSRAALFADNLRRLHPER
jgi:hypothetical protein